MALTLAEANRIVQGTIAKAEEFNIKICVAVVDAGGRMVAFNRMDGAHWTGTYGAPGKAVAAAGYGRPSGAIDPDRHINRGIIAAEGGHIIAEKGGVPIIRNGVIDGACGVGGGTSEQDEDCASAGVSLV